MKNLSQTDTIAISGGTELVFTQKVDITGISEKCVHTLFLNDYTFNVDHFLDDIFSACPNNELELLLQSLENITQSIELI